MSQFQQDIDAIASLRAQQGGTWDDINPEYAARMKLQNRFKTGLDVALETLKQAWHQRKLNIDQVTHFAKITRAAKVMQPYLEAVVA